ncbi:MAG: HEAT repeat domain-containing protein [Desulfobulbaceae bacterium]|nr:HEAT repeat domain-containing protein [Desulfobulbaceae bacterium]
MTTSFLRIPFIDLLRSLLITMHFLLFAGLATLASAATMEITVKNDLISVELVDVPLIEVLQRVKQEFGFKAHFHGDLSELITLSFTDFPLEKCLQQLTANHSLSVASLSPTKLPEQNDEKQIAEVWVISRSAISRNLNVPPVASVLPSSDLINNTAKVNEKAPELADDGEQEGVPLGQLLNDPDAKRSSKRQAINELAAVGDAASVLTMAESLGNEDKEVRQLLVAGISSVENEESTRVLGQVLQDESDPAIRKIAVRALGQRKDDVVVQALLQGAMNDEDEEVRILAEQLLTQ